MKPNQFYRIASSIINLYQVSNIYVHESRLVIVLINGHVCNTEFTNTDQATYELNRIYAYMYKLPVTASEASVT